MSLVTFHRLKLASFTHSAVYLGLLFCSLAPGLEGPTTVFGWAHGIGWILMSVLCLAAVPRRVLSLRTAVAVVVLGGVGPFFGSIAFVLEVLAFAALGLSGWLGGELSYKHKVGVSEHDDPEATEIGMSE